MNFIFERQNWSTIFIFILTNGLHNFFFDGQWSTQIMNDQNEFSLLRLCIYDNNEYTKVVLFVWRLFRNRLPTKDNLFRRGVINQNSLECVADCDSAESSVHLLLHRNIFESV